MQLIIRISRSGRNYTVICDDGSEYVIDSDALRSSGLEPGDEVEQTVLEELAYRTAYKAARERALYTVGRREMCREGLIRLLTAKDGCTHEIASEVADEMEELGFINELRFAQMLADYLYREKHYGCRRVVMDMTVKGVCRELAESVASEYQPDVSEALDELLSGRMGRELDTPTGIRRAMNNLLRYGYSAGDIRSAIERAAGSEE